MTTQEIFDAIKGLKVKAMKRKDKKEVRILDKVLGLFCAGPKAGPGLRSCR